MGLISEWPGNEGTVERRDSNSNLGGTMRLGAQECILEKSTLVRSLYKKEKIKERHRHRYEVNNNLIDKLISKGLNQNPPQKAVGNFVLSIAWRLDWLTHLLTGKKRKLTKNLCKTLTKKSYYSSDKFLKTNTAFKFKPISEEVSEVCQLFSKTV